jgi:hypothetical protein
VSRWCHTPIALLRATAACALLVLLTLAAFARPAAAAIPTELPPQGLYESCGPAERGQACADRLAHMRSGGFTLVLNYRQWWATEADIRHYADTAQRLGMKIIWPFDSAPWRTGGDLRARYPQLAATCGCSDNAGFKRYVVGLVRDLPATWGYYVGDEVPEAQHVQARAFADQIKALDPNHPTMVVSVEYQGSQAAGLAPFADTVDVLAGDYYPIGTESADTTGPIAGHVGDLAAAHGKPAGMVLQAFSWEMYPEKGMAAPRWPTPAEMRRMRDLSLERARAGLILWYSYFDIVGSAEPERHWADLIAGAFAPLPTPEPPAPAPAPEPQPEPKRAAPAKPLVRVPARVRRHRARAAALRWRLEGSDRAELTVYRVVRKRRERVKRMWVEGSAGKLAVKRLLRAGRRARPGVYALTLRASLGGGALSAPAGARFRVLP